VKARQHSGEHGTAQILRKFIPAESPAMKIESRRNKKNVAAAIPSNWQSGNRLAFRAAFPHQ